ncbi:hypothetical protein [Methanocalculus sp.]|uniref:hypothetical protein n=1 Tax=Methanocalculus sp. TaxID=2004547 RepID=UPI00262C47BC|nr:hypothetical protein [Methanocalculus sp.]MDG6249294.1 hypothetical protein [Methanocalculus sp.]
MTEYVFFERIVLYIVVFIIIFVIFLSAGYLAQADHEGRSGNLVVPSPLPTTGAGHQPIGCWFHSGSDPLLGPFEERLELMSIGTFRSEILAPAFAEDLIIIRGFWRRGDDSSIGLFVSNLMINEIRYDPSEKIFVNLEGYRYERICSRDTPERLRMTLFSSLPDR